MSDPFFQHTVGIVLWWRPHCWVLSSPTHPRTQKVENCHPFWNGGWDVLFTPLRLINAGLHYIRIKSTSKIYSHTSFPLSQTCSLFNFFSPTTYNNPLRMWLRLQPARKKKSGKGHILTDDKRAFYNFLLETDEAFFLFWKIRWKIRLFMIDS